MQNLKALKRLDNQEIARLVRDPESYHSYLQSINRNKVTKVVAPPEPEEDEFNEEF